MKTMWKVSFTFMFVFFCWNSLQAAQDLREEQRSIDSSWQQTRVSDEPEPSYLLAASSSDTASDASSSSSMSTRQSPIADSVSTNSSPVADAVSSNHSPVAESVSSSPANPGVTDFRIRATSSTQNISSSSQFSSSGKGTSGTSLFSGSETTTGLGGSSINPFSGTSGAGTDSGIGTTSNQSEFGQ